MYGAMTSYRILLHDIIVECGKWLFTVFQLLNDVCIQTSYGQDNYESGQAHEIETSDNIFWVPIAHCTRSRLRTPSGT